MFFAHFRRDAFLRELLQPRLEPARAALTRERGANCVACAGIHPAGALFQTGRPSSTGEFLSSDLDSMRGKPALIDPPRARIQEAAGLLDFHGVQGKKHGFSGPPINTTRKATVAYPTVKCLLFHMLYATHPQKLLESYETEGSVRCDNLD